MFGTFEHLPCGITIARSLYFEGWASKKTGSKDLSMMSSLFHRVKISDLFRISYLSSLPNRLAGRAY
jgi:hypothetical protein